MADPPSPTGGETVPPGALTDLLRELAQAPEEPGPAWETGLRPGTVIDRFELVRELGRGGFGVVWEARDRRLKRDVAFKAVLPGGRTELREARLLEEAEAAARLSHPNIVAIHDVGKAEAGPYLVLELLHGQTLSERLAGERLPVAEAVSIAREVAKGLAHAHARAVVHRDLKPDNVFLCDDGQVKVLDFGMAQAFGRRKVEGGTSGYMAPEQRRGSPEDERTDVYALGVMLHRMLAGALPFPPDDERTDPPAPRLEVPGAPSLGPLVGQMLAWEPAERPRDGGAVVTGLQAAERELSAGPPGSDVPRVVPPARVASRRRVALAVAALAIAAAAGGIWRYTRPRPAPTAPEQPSIAVLAFADMSPQHDQEYLADGVAEEILNALSRIEGLKVIGRSSSFFFKGKSVALPEIARQLGVTSLLEGSVRREGNRIRVTAQLVRAADGVRVWSESFDREMASILALQEDVARNVTRALQSRLGLAASLPRAETPEAVRPEAYTQFLLGMQIAKSADAKVTAGRSREALRRAVVLDPNLAVAWAQLSSQLALPDAGEATVPAARLEEAEGAAERAISLAPWAPEGYSARAWLRLIAFDWDGARSDALRALQLRPGDVAASSRMALLSLAEGRVADAVSLYQRNAELDPLYSHRWDMLAMALSGVPDPAGMRRAAHRALEISPDSEEARLRLLDADLLEGRGAEVLKAVAGLRHEDDRLSYAILAEHALGNTVAAEKELIAFRERFAQESWIGSATLHARLGHVDEAFADLDRWIASDQRHGGVAAYARVDPFLRPLHSDPRWKDFLRKVNLPVE